MVWSRWQDFFDRWGKTYRSFKMMRDNLYYMDDFTYLDYDYRIQSMIYTTNWIERLQKDFRRVTKMRGAMPNDESVLTLMGKTAMDKNSYGKQIPRIDYDKILFPDVKHKKDSPHGGQAPYYQGVDPSATRSKLG